MKKISICLIAFISFNSLTAFDLDDAQEKYRYLDTLALEAGTDKSSISHNYTKVYAEYFDKYRNQPIRFLEIGILLGNSVKLWENYFSAADLHFIDINSTQIQYHSGRSQYHFLDQSDANELLKFAKSIDGHFDIIIDDGGHRMDQQIISFETLFPFVKSGGMYIIEDLHTSYWADWGGNGTLEHPLAGPGTAVHYLEQLVDELNYTGARTGVADQNKFPSTLKFTLNEYQDKIDSIHFYKSLCIIRKQ